MDNLNPQEKAVLENRTLIETIVANVGVQHVDGSPFVMTPADFNIHDLEYMMEMPLRKRGRVTMLDAVSFITYFNRHKNDGSSSIYATVEPPKFIGILDDDSAGNDAGWRDHQVTYACPLSKEWQTWKNVAGKTMTQIQFSEFIETNLADIHSEPELNDPTAADMLEVANNFRAQKKVNFASGQLLSNGQVDFKYQEEVEGTAGANGTIKVPERFFIAIPVFEGGSPYRLEAKLRWRLEGGKLSMWYDLVRDHKTLEAAFLDIWTEISTNTSTTIFRGMAPAK